MGTNLRFRKEITSLSVAGRRLFAHDTTLYRARKSLIKQRCKQICETVESACDCFLHIFQYLLCCFLCVEFRRIDPHFRIERLFVGLL